MAKPPSLGVALIARDAAQTIGPCLDSIRPYAQQIVVCVDERTTDRTAEVARAHGADLVPSIRVSDWHECPRHGRVLAQHFARARNESFTYLDRSLDWWMWLDSDDVLKGGERLAQVLADVPDEAVGVWLPYAYATLHGGSVVNTLFHRERVLRRAVGWRWEHRVHEVVVPEAPNPQWLMADQVQVYHQEGAHKSESSAARNLLLLEIDLEEDPENPRTLFYLGNQYFALGDWRSAIAYYEHLCSGIGKNPYELWQASCYTALAYLKLNDLDGATQAAFAAIDVRPEHPEPYFILEQVYLLAGEFDKALWWYQEGKKKTPPPFFVFKNPMDYTFNCRVAASDALMQLGRVSEARAELEQAYQACPDERVLAQIEKQREIETHAERAAAFVAMAETMGEGWAVEYGPQLPAGVRAHRRVRDRYVPVLLAHGTGRPRLVIWCGRSHEPWYPGTLEETGIGGSETAVVEIARRFAADGWRVDVYNGADRYEGVYDGVGYWDPERWTGLPETADLYISWRQPHAHRPFGKTILWCHDLNYGPQAAEAMRQWDLVLGVSQWHADYLRALYGLPAVDYVPNGVNLERFDPSVPKLPFRCVYASSPDRGLERLLRLWPRIVEHEPGAELHIAYGWKVFDALAATRPGMQEYKARVMQLVEQTPQVVWRDRLPQGQLARLYGESVAWLYPTSFLEVSCISAMEAMAGGAVPVCSSAGALKETVGAAGAVVPGLPESRAFQDFYVHVARGVLSDVTLHKPLEHAARQRARELTWDAAYERWKQHVEALLGSKREVAVA